MEAQRYTTHVSQGQKASWEALVGGYLLKRLCTEAPLSAPSSFLLGELRRHPTNMTESPSVLGSMQTLGDRLAVHSVSRARNKHGDVKTRGAQGSSLAWGPGEGPAHNVHPH